MQIDMTDTFFFQVPIRDFKIEVLDRHIGDLFYSLLLESWAL